jgi:bacillithiol biosynthesis cysteine-adding enzyme BshC
VGGPLLVEDYLAGAAPAVEYYAGAPFDLAGYRRKADAVRERFGRSERARAAEAVRPTSARARDRLARFVEEGGVMVTTGQQAGLLTGPLYTLYKAFTAARLAEVLERELGQLVLPVFWTASEDHDWEEVNHAYLALERDGIRRIELPGTPDVPLPMADMTVGEGARMVLGEMSDLLVGNDDNAELLKWIEGAYQADASVATAFSELLGRLLGRFDFCMTEASHPAVKAASVGVLRESLERSGEHERVLRERTQRIEADGYHTQVAVLEGGTNVFRQGASGRERIYVDGDGFRVAGERGVKTLEELREEMEADPGRFSPNVFLRPVVESTVFPTVAYVGGPGEISYFAQLSALFPEFGIEPPMVFPRGSLLLVETPMRRLLEKLEVEVTELERPRHELVELLAQGSMPEAVRSTLDELNHALSDGYRRLIDEAKAIDPTLEGALARLRNEALSRVGDSERKVAQHIKRKESVRIGQLDRLLAHLRPEGQPQDRVLNVIPYLARHGLGLLDRLYEEIRVELR